MTAPARLAYVSAEYPKPSHTFIMREVLALRALGAEVDTFSIRRTPETDLLSQEDRDEAGRTFAVLPPAWPALIRAHITTALRSPRRYAETLRLASGLSAPGARNRLWQFFYFVEAVLVADRLRRRKITHVHAHFVNVAASVALLAARLAGDDTRWSFTMHGPLEFDDVTLHAVPAKVERADLVVCISDFARAQLMRQVAPEQWPKLHVVHCGVSPDEYADRPSLPRRGSGTVEVVSVGRLAAMKGFPILLAAVRRLAEDGVDVRLTLVGDGEDGPRLREQARRDGIADRVRFAGALEPAAVARTLAGADVFCLPSLAEGVPVVLMEAMATGLPVVATRIMGIPELVEDGVSGLLVPPGRPEPLAAAVRRLAESPEQRRAMGAAGQAAVRSGFDVSASAARLLELFSQERR